MTIDFYKKNQHYVKCSKVDVNQFGSWIDVCDTLQFEIFLKLCLYVIVLINFTMLK